VPGGSCSSQEVRRLFGAEDRTDRKTGSSFAEGTRFRKVSRAFAGSSALSQERSGFNRGVRVPARVFGSRPRSLRGPAKGFGALPRASGVRKEIRGVRRRSGSFRKAASKRLSQEGRSGRPAGAGSAGITGRLRASQAFAGHATRTVISLHRAGGPWVPYSHR